ncbi:hypothetical protein ACROYT_G022301 [Oculina patagonica]
MGDKAKAVAADQPGQSAPPGTVELKAMFSELLNDAKKDILAQVKGSIDQVYMDFDSAEVEAEDPQPVTGANPEDNQDAAVAEKIEGFIQPKKPDEDKGSSDSFKSLAEEFSVIEKTAPAIDANLAEIVKSLINEKLSKEKLSELCNNSSGEQKNVLTHAAVLLLSANRDLNLKRRDLICPDLNKQYASLCNPSTTISTFLFGDDLNKEVEELTKSNKLSNKVTPKQRMEPYKVPGGRGQRCQTLTFLDMSEKYMQRNGECFNFALTDHLKQDRPGKVFGNVRLFKYPVKELCVYETLDYYLKATENFRNSTRLLVSYIKPYKAVTSSTVGRWVRTMLCQAGIDTEKFSAHSTRCASTSKAIASVSTDVILATAGWTEESTFRTFYNKPVAVTNQMSLSVLE